MTESVPRPADLPLMILCGGKGTRLRDVTELLPKPMVPIGEQPIVWHIMKYYASFGVRRFILCLGYKREEFIDYFMNYRARNCDCTIDLAQSGKITYHQPCGAEDWSVTLVDTGLETTTGGRISRAARYLAPEDENFFLTYGDGLSNVDLNALCEHHEKCGKLLTLSAVHPEGRFGELILDGPLAAGFAEKPAQLDGYISGGYMIIRRAFLARYMREGEDVFFESGAMMRAVAEGEMAAYRHEGFWQCMDTPREYQLLTHLWNKGDAPWVR